MKCFFVKLFLGTGHATKFDLAQLSFPFTAYWVYTVYTAYTVQTVYIVKTKAFKLLEQVGTLLVTAIELLSKMWVEWSGWVMEWMISLRLLGP